MDDAGDLPQHVDECRKEQDAVKRGLAQIDSRLGRHANILGDAPVRIVRVARDQAELIVFSFRHPDRQRGFRDPDAPGELQAPLGIKCYGEHADAGQKQKHERHDLLEERLEVAGFQRVVKPRRPGIQAYLDRNLRNRQGRDQCQAAPVPPFVLRREEGQGKMDETPEKVGVITHPFLGLGAVGGRILRHGLSAPCLAKPCRKMPGQPTARRTHALCSLLFRKPDRHTGIREQLRIGRRCQAAPA